VTDICRTRPPRGPDSGCRVIQDPEVVTPHLEDAAHYPGGHAGSVAYPRSESDVARVVRSAASILRIGAQSSLTGGATPFGEVLLSTARLSRVLDVSASRISVEAGVTLDAVQAASQAIGAAYPPAPTFTGATAGGIVATNAAGAATFKYGSTRDWVEEITVVLASSEVLDVRRGQWLAPGVMFP
jgi:D-lactate dehydrogenase (cytochrome)